MLHAGTTADPALVSGSLCRHVRIVVEPDGSGERVTVYLSSLTPKEEPFGDLEEMLQANLEDVAGQTALPSAVRAAGR